MKARHVWWIYANSTTSGCQMRASNPFGISKSPGELFSYQFFGPRNFIATKKQTKKSHSSKRSHLQISGVFLGSVEEMDLPIWEKVLANWQQRIDANELEPGSGFFPKVLCHWTDIYIYIRTIGWYQWYDIIYIIDLGDFNDRPSDDYCILFSGEARNLTDLTPLPLPQHPRSLPPPRHGTRELMIGDDPKATPVTWRVSEWNGFNKLLEKIVKAIEVMVFEQNMHGILVWIVQVVISKISLHEMKSWKLFLGLSLFTLCQHQESK